MSELHELALRKLEHLKFATAASDAKTTLLNSNFVAKVTLSKLQIKKRTRNTLDTDGTAQTRSNRPFRTLTSNGLAQTKPYQRSIQPRPNPAAEGAGIDAKDTNEY